MLNLLLGQLFSDAEQLPFMSNLESLLVTDVQNHGGKCQKLASLYKYMFAGRNWCVPMVTVPGNCGRRLHYTDIPGGLYAIFRP